MISFLSGLLDQKDRLYVVLYITDKEDDPGGPPLFHWALGIMPKADGDTFHILHAVNRPPASWVLEDLVDKVVMDPVAVARILIGKVIDNDGLVETIRRVPVLADDPNFTCRTWLKSAIETISKMGGLVEAPTLDWSTIQERCEQYGGPKRFQTLGEKLPTYDMIQGKELVT